MFEKMIDLPPRALPYRSGPETVMLRLRGGVGLVERAVRRSSFRIREI